MKPRDNNEKFTNCGIRNTTQRNLVFDALKAAGCALTADEIYIRLSEKNKAISLSTIYRILEVFSAKGLILKTSIFNEKKFVYEINEAEHKHYLICARCNKKIGISHCPLHALEKSLAEETKYKIVGHKLDIYGYCPECQKKMQQEFEAAREIKD